MTSTDGFCSTVIFDPGELGEIHPGPAPTTIHSTSHMSSRPSPSTVSNPTFSSLLARAPSPARSNSSSSVATVSAYTSTTPKISNVPSSTILSAASPNSTFVQPTMTSHSTSNRGASFSSTGSAPHLGTPPESPATLHQKREGDSSESAVDSSADEPKSKKRRVAPTLISPADLQK
jgi:chromatin assembly factor 1 subunit B